jgi:hypothetical protein
MIMMRIILLYNLTNLKTFISTSTPPTLSSCFRVFFDILTEN